MPRRRYFIDTNVYLIAVTDPTSDQAALVRLATRGEIEVVLSDMLLKEISRVFRRELKRPAAALATRMVVRMSGARTVWAFEWAHLEPEVKALVADKTDVPHVCAAMVAAADAFVTDDTKLNAHSRPARIPHAERGPSGAWAGSVTRSTMSVPIEHAQVYFVFRTNATGGQYGAGTWVALIAPGVNPNYPSRLDFVAGSALYTHIETTGAPEGAGQAQNPYGPDTPPPLRCDGTYDPRGMRRVGQAQRVD